MHLPKREAVFAVLRERSTIAGIAGVLVAILGLFGLNTNEALVSELVLLLISIVAIATRPKEKWDGHTDRRHHDHHGSHGDHVCGTPAADKTEG